MATASIDFTEQQQQEQVEVYKDSPTESELTSMVGIGAILKPLYDAEETFKARFAPQMAMQVIAFRDAYWTPKSHDTVCINGVEMTWNDFVEQVPRSNSFREASFFSMGLLSIVSHDCTARGTRPNR